MTESDYLALSPDDQNELWEAYLYQQANPGAPMMPVGAVVGALVGSWVGGVIPQPPLPRPVLPPPAHDVEPPK
jgi:hypothetical protein